MPKYNPNMIGDRFDIETLDKLYLVKKMKQRNVTAYEDFINRLKKLPASYGIAVNAMIRGDGKMLAEELGDGSYEYFNEAMIPAMLEEFESGGIKPVNPEKSANEFNKPMTVLDRMGAIVEDLQAENAGRAAAIKDAKTKMESDIRNRKRELKVEVDKSYSSNPFKRWAHRRSEMRKFEAAEKAKYDAFCREQKEQSDNYNAKIQQYNSIKERGKLFGSNDWVDEMDSFINHYETMRHLDRLSQTPLPESSKYYADAQEIKKPVKWGKQFQTQQERGAAQKSQKNITIKNPMKEIQKKDEL